MDNRAHCKLDFFPFTIRSRIPIVGLKLFDEMSSTGFGSISAVYLGCYQTKERVKKKKFPGLYSFFYKNIFYKNIEPEI